MKYKKTSDKVLESVRYEPLKDLLDVPEPTGLDQFFAGSVVEPETNNWRKHWKGMPEFVNEENKPYHEIKVKFPTKEDMEAFAAMVDREITKKTKNIEYPQRTQRQKPLEFAWVDKDDV